MARFVTTPPGTRAALPQGRDSGKSRWWSASPGPRWRSTCASSGQFGSWSPARVSRIGTSERPTGELEFLVNVLHSLTVASWTPNDGHPTGIFPTEFGRTDRHINNDLVDQHLLTAYRARSRRPNSSSVGACRRV